MCIADTILFSLQFDKAILGEQTTVEGGDNKHKTYYSSFKYIGEEFKLGDHVYLDPNSFSFSVKPAKIKKPQADTSRRVRQGCRGHENLKLYAQVNFLMP